MCPTCGNRRWLTVEVPVGHPDFGKAQPCQCQVEASAGERESRLRRYANLGPLSRRTFGSLDLNGRVRRILRAVRLFGIAAYGAAMFVRGRADRLAGTLTGPNGSGKTHLAAAIANHCIENGRPVFFVHVPDLLDDLRSTYAPASDMSYSELFEQVITTRRSWSWTGSARRVRRRGRRRSSSSYLTVAPSAEFPTVITTAANLSEIDPYIVSRMTDPDLSRVLEVGSRVQGP